MDNKRLLEQFFDWENNRQWKDYETLISPEIEWTLFSSEEQKVFRGKEAYMEKILLAYQDNNQTFSCVEMWVSSDGKRIVTRLENSCGHISVDIFDFEDGVIVREWEYLM